MDHGLPHGTRGAHAQGGGTGMTGSDEVTVAALKQALERAEKKLEIVGSVTRHDVLNQLTAILGYNELLSTMIHGEQELHYLEVTRRASDKIRRILAYSKVFQNIGAEPPRWQKIDMLVRAARDEVNPGQVAIRTDVGGSSVWADPLFFKVFSYLIDNAIRHGNHTTEIRISLRSGKEGLLLSIQDNGSGIRQEEKEKIFERGYGKQTGWGLFVAREICAANGMMIRENGAAGTGASFEILIPAHQVKTV